MIDAAEVIIIGKNEDEFRQLKDRLNGGRIVIDLVRLLNDDSRMATRGSVGDSQDAKLEPRNAKRILYASSHNNSSAAITSCAASVTPADIQTTDRQSDASRWKASTAPA